MKLAIVFHDKVNLAIAVFSFALIGVPLGIRISRRETSANLGLALGLVLSYYVLTVMVKWLDRHPEYRPDLLLWLPNVLFLALGVWLYLNGKLTILTILALGSFAAQTLLDTKLSIGKLRGSVHQYHGIPLVVTYHPAALLRNAAWKRPTWEDVQLARRILDRPRDA